MFLYEKDLKDTFWKAYNGKGRAKQYQFECPIQSQALIKVCMLNI